VSGSEGTSTVAAGSGGEGWIDGLLERFRSLRVLVVGDLLLDEYRFGDVARVSPEAPVPVVRVQSVRSVLGGAGNVARGLVSLGARCDLVAVVGEDAEGEEARRQLDALGIPAEGLLRSADRPTSHKLRVVARAQQMLRLDREIDDPIRPEDADFLRAAVARRLPDCDVVVLQDYDKGIFADGLGGWIIEQARARGRAVVADPKSDLGRFRGATLVKPNLAEARRFVEAETEPFEGRRALLEKIQHALGGCEVVVTRGREGMTALDARGAAFDVPTRPAEVFDVQGAGDTSLVLLALCRAAGTDLREACIVANAAASVAVEKVGTAIVEPAELRARWLEGALSIREGA
jgi:D-beta-D-heptose 7-phosphate kinase/D-beta-D-heptose 1-phosphate adenosyltransferase